MSEADLASLLHHTFIGVFEQALNQTPDYQDSTHQHASVICPDPHRKNFPHHAHRILISRGIPSKVSSANTFMPDIASARRMP